MACLWLRAGSHLNGWTVEEAIHEMKAFHYKEFLHPNMKWYVRKFPERLAKSPVLAAFRRMPKNSVQVLLPSTK